MGKRSVNDLATAARLLAACEGTYENLEVFSFFLSLPSSLRRLLGLLARASFGGQAGRYEWAKGRGIVNQWFLPSRLKR
jgi:hypothetical protein